MQKPNSLFTLAGVLFSSSLLAASAVGAQTTGTSHPESLDDSITVSRPKPSPAVPMEATAPVLQQRATATPPSTGPAVACVASPSATPSIYTADSDEEGIVHPVSSAANVLPEGTLLRVKLSQEISTRGSEPNVRFSAFISSPLMKFGRVAVPAGSVLTGRITELNSGHHIGKAAGIHLQPEFITLPGGTRYKVEGQVIDLFADHRTHVSHEGTIIGNDSTPGTATAVGVATGTGAVAGAVLGAGVGALVGAGIGAGVGGAVWANQETSSTLRAGTEIVFSLNRPMLLENTPITVE